MAPANAAGCSQRQEDIAAALVADDLSAIENPAALSFRQFAESRASDLHALGTRPKTPVDGLKAPAAFLGANCNRSSADCDLS